MKTYFNNKLLLIGLALLLFGSGPLVFTMIAAKLGITADPNPNPVYFGMMAMFTFWPGIILLALGIYTGFKSNRDETK